MEFSKPDLAFSRAEDFAGFQDGPVFFFLPRERRRRAGWIGGGAPFPILQERT